MSTAPLSATAHSGVNHFRGAPSNGETVGRISDEADVGGLRPRRRRQRRGVGGHPLLQPCNGCAIEEPTVATPPQGSPGCNGCAIEEPTATTVQDTAKPVRVAPGCNQCATDEWPVTTPAHDTARPVRVAPCGSGGGATEEPKT
jgi:hypothetical protein